jgi:hypothetical protein
MIHHLACLWSKKSRVPGAGSLRRPCRRLAVLEGLEARTLLSGAPTVYTVDSLSDTGTGSGNTGDLRYCIAQANTNPNTDGSLIQFDPSVFNASQLESIVVRSPLDLTGTAGPITIAAPIGTVTGESQIEGALEDAVEISGANAVAPFDIGPGVTATFSGLVILYGVSAANGGAVVNTGTLTLNGSVVGDSTAAGSGGAIQNNGTMTINDAYIAGNTAQASGGSGGGIANSGSLTISGSVIAANQVTGNAGLGGGIFSTGTLDVQDSAFEVNSVTGTGGFGGGICNSGTLEVQSCAIINNSVSGGAGGGICNNSTGTVDVTLSAFSDNTTGTPTGAGGAIVNAGQMAVADSEFDSNTAGTYGGGIANIFAGKLLISYCTLANNSAGSQGGGIENGATMQAVNLTIADNSVSTAAGGGGLFAGGGSTTIDNTIVASNSDTTGADDIAGTVLASSAYNLIARGGAGVLTNGVNDNQVGVAPDFDGSLSANGGVTETIALEYTSPEIDAGGNFPVVDPISGQPLATDQRGPGFVRANNGGIDIGAYELQPATVSAVSVRWGTAGLATLQTAADGLRLLPAGRNTDLPWTGIKGIIITFDEPLGSLDFGSANVTVSGAGGVQYGPVEIKGPFHPSTSSSFPFSEDSGLDAEVVYDIIFAQPIEKPDRVTITITSTGSIEGGGIVPYTRRLDVLPGDFYDTGVVTKKDITTIHNESTGKNGAQPTIFGEILGDGTVNASDFKAARKFQGDRLPKLPKAGGKRPKVALDRRSPFTSSPFAPRKDLLRLARRQDSDVLSQSESRHTRVARFV